MEIGGFPLSVIGCYMYNVSFTEVNAMFTPFYSPYHCKEILGILHLTQLDTMSFFSLLIFPQQTENRLKIGYKVVLSYLLNK